MDDGVYRCVGHGKTRSTHLWNELHMMVCVGHGKTSQGVLVVARQGQHTCGNHYR